MARRILIVTDDKEEVVAVNVRQFERWYPGREIVVFDGDMARLDAAAWILRLNTEDPEAEVCLFTDWDMPSPKDGETHIRRTLEILGERCKLIIVHASTANEPIVYLAMKLGREIRFIFKPPTSEEKERLRSLIESFFTAP